MLGPEFDIAHVTSSLEVTAVAELEFMDTPYTCNYPFTEWGPVPGGTAWAKPARHRKGHTRTLWMNGSEAILAG